MINLDFEKMGGVIIAVVQDVNIKEVLMVGVMNGEALEETIRSGRVTFWSRTKKRLWTKGETSGNYLRLRSILLDCDNDTVLCLVNSMGPACHTGAQSCFYNTDGSPRQYE